MSHNSNQASSAASMGLTGAQYGSYFGPIGTAVGAALGLLGGYFGAGGRELPKGIMSGKEARKLLGQGLSADEILAMGPVGSFHPGQAFKKLTKMGLSEEDAYRLLASGGQGADAGKLAKKFPELAAKYAAGGGAAGSGPMGMQAFQDLMPAILGNPTAFASPAASQWLQSLFPAPQSPQGGSDRDPACRDGARVAAKRSVRPVDVLHRQAQVRERLIATDVNGVEQLADGLPLVPGHRGPARHHVLAFQRRDRHDARIHLADARDTEAVLTDLLEHFLVVADQVHLVDRDDDVADAEQRDDVRVPARLHLHAARGVHEDHGEVRGRSAGRHVARVLLVSRTVGDDVLAPVGVEVTVGDVDRDALLSLGLQAVDEQREVHFPASRAPLAAVRGHRGELVLEDLLRVVQQAPDQRALAGRPRCRR